MCQDRTIMYNQISSRPPPPSTSSTTTTTSSSPPPPSIGHSCGLIVFTGRKMGHFGSTSCALPHRRIQRHGQWPDCRGVARWSATLASPCWWINVDQRGSTLHPSLAKRTNAKNLKDDPSFTRDCNFTGAMVFPSLAARQEFENTSAKIDQPPKQNGALNH